MKSILDNLKNLVNSAACYIIVVGLLPALLYWGAAHAIPPVAAFWKWWIVGTASLVYFNHGTKGHNILTRLIFYSWIAAILVIILRFVNILP